MRNFILLCLFISFSVTIKGEEVFEISVAEGIDMRFSIPDADKKEVTVAASGATAAISIHTTGDFVIPSKITYNETEYTVTGISNYAFYQCDNLTSVTIPETIKSIGNHAFDLCSETLVVKSKIQKVFDLEDYTFVNLNYFNKATLYVPVGTLAAYKDANGWKEFSVIEPDSELGVVTFSEKIGSSNERLLYFRVLSDEDKTVEVSGYTPNDLSKVSVPSLTAHGWKVVRIGDHALSGGSLRTISLPNTITSIGDYAFFMTNWNDISIPENVAAIGKCAFKDSYYKGKLVIPDAVKSIGEDAFRSMRITSLELGSGITDFGQNAFYDCTYLTSVMIKDGVTRIGESSFERCLALNSIDLPNSVLSVGTNAFYGCSSLKIATIGTGMQTISDNMFGGCSSLSEITFRGNITTIGKYAFRGCDFLSFEVPNTVTTIGDYAFRDCSKMASCSLPFTLTSLGRGVFSGCASLKSISLPGCVSKIEGLSFSGCTSLESIMIPEGVTSIDMAAFTDLTALKSLTLPSTITSIGPRAFSNCTSLQFIDLRDCSKLTITNVDRSDNGLTPGMFANVPASTIIYLPEGSNVTGENIVNTNLITFADAEVKRICLENWDSDKDGQLSVEETMAVTDLNNVFRDNKSITSFDELKYFTGLKAINYLDFDGCTNLETISLPASLEEIGDAPFGNCNALKSIVIPASVKKIGNTNIGTCLWNLESIQVEEGNTVYDSRGNCNAIIETASNKLIVGCQSTVIPDDVTTIAAWAFNTCTEKPIVIPEGVTTIEKSAFLGNHFKTIVLPSTLSSMTRAFNGCSLKMVESHITDPFALDELTFDMADNAVLYVPKGTKEKYGAMEGWKKFAAIIELEDETEDNVINFEDEAVKQLCFDNWDVNASGELSFNEAAGILNLERVFYTSNISKFQELQYFIRLKSIGEYAFRESGLTDVVLPQSVESIEHGAFLGCKMTELDIPANVASIGENAFLRCSKLASLKVNWKTPIDIQEKAFPTRSNVVLHVPLGCKAAYEAAEVWKDFKEITDDYTEGGVTFASKDDGTLMLSNADNTSVQIRIPSTLTVDGQEYSVTGIGESAFENYETLETVSIPGSIAEIGEKAFAGCKNLVAIFNYGENPADLIGTVKALTRSGEEVSVAAKVFAEVDLETCELYVPAGCSQKYKATEGWNEFQNIIEMIKGDANGDKKVNAADVVEAINAMNGQPSANFIEFNADIDGNGEITDADVQAISNIIMGIEISGKALSEATNEDVGSVIASDGNVYPAGTIGIAPIAMIVYVGDPGTADKNSSTYRGLAIALSDDGIYTGYDQKKSGPYNIVLDVQGDLNGLSCPWNKPMSDAPEGTSGWFIPSSGQFYLFLKSLEMERHDDYEGFEKNRFDLPYYYSKDTDSEYGYLDEPVYDIVTMLRKAGDLSVDFDYTGQLFWSCTYNGGNDRNYYLSFNRGGVKITYGAADAKARFRPFLAF